MFLLEEKPGLDGGEGVADFVGHAGGEHAQRGQLFLAFGDLLALHQLDLQSGRNHVTIDDHWARPAAGHHQQGQRDEEGQPEDVQ